MMLNQIHIEREAREIEGIQQTAFMYASRFTSRLW